jgi:hypothetical protein
LNKPTASSIGIKTTFLGFTPFFDKLFWGPLISHLKKFKKGRYAAHYSKSRPPHPPQMETQTKRWADTSSRLQPPTHLHVVKKAFDEGQLTPPQQHLLKTKQFKMS